MYSDGLHYVKLIRSIYIVLVTFIRKCKIVCPLSGTLNWFYVRTLKKTRGAFM